MINYSYTKTIKKHGKPRYYMRITLPIIIAFSLTGCENSSISAVKESYIDDRMTMTTSQLLDNRRICESVEWRNFEDQHKRIVVEYKCTFINTKDFLAEKRASYINNQNISLSNRIRNLEEEIFINEEKISKLTKNGSEIAKRRLEEYISYNQEPKETTEHLVKLIHTTEELKKLRENYSDNAYINLLMTDDFKYLIQGPALSGNKEQMLSYFWNNMGPFTSQVGWMKREKTATQREEYKRNNVDHYLQRMREYIDDLVYYFDEQMEIEMKHIKEEKESYFSKIDSMKKEILESINEDIDNSKKNIINIKKSILHREEELKTLKEKSDEQFPIYEKIIEKFQWVVNKENQPTLAYGDVVAVSSESMKNKTLIKHSNSENSLVKIHKINSDNYEDYLKKLSTINLLNFIYN